MKAFTFTMQRSFILGTTGKAGAAEIVQFSVTWGIEDNETLEQAEEQGAQLLYAMAARERKRRYGLIEAWQNDLRSKQKRATTPESGATAE
jgi:hypothetical protein